MPSAHLLFIVTFIGVNLHVSRNLSAVGYAIIYLIVSALQVNSLLKKIKSRPGAFSGREGRTFEFLLAWCSLGLIGFLVTAIISGPTTALIGLSRFLFAVPILLALILFTDNAKALRKNISIAVAFFAVAASTIPMQLITGPISWFAQESERGGLARYSSLVGSITSLGVIAGCYLILLAATRPAIAIPAYVLIVSSAALSLSKAAIANIVIASLILIWINRRGLGKFAMASIAVYGSLVLSFIALPSLQTRLDTVLLSFGLQTGGAEVVNYDTAVDESLTARLTTIPLENFGALADLHSPLSYLVGGGFGMASTALVPQSASLARMAHNQFAELITVFGLIGGTAAIAAMLFILVRLTLRRSVSRISEAGLYCYIVFLANSLFANGTLYQPASASIFFICIFLATCPISLLRNPTPGDNSRSGAHSPSAPRFFYE